MAEPSGLSGLFNLPPEQASAYLKAKGERLTWNWWEMQRAAHAADFTVAKLAKLDVLQDIRTAVQAAIDSGQTERWFKAQLVDTLKAKGWWGPQVDVDPVTMEAQLYQAGSLRRLQTIYRTNLQTAYMAGRWQQFAAQRERAPYVQCLAVMDSNTRPAHAALHGLVFRIDDPALGVIAPPNGFNCRCRLRNLDETELAERGLSVETDARVVVSPDPGPAPVDPRTGESPATWQRRGVSVPSRTGHGRETLMADAGWDYNPGEAAGAFRTPAPRADLPPSTWTGGARCPGGAADHAESGCPGPVPTPRPFDAGLLLPAGQADAWYVERFLAPFGADLTRPAVFEDVTGEPLTLSAELFTDRAKTARAGSPIYKVQKNGREAWLPLLAQTIREPQEIWERVEYHAALDKTVLRRRYLAWWELAGQEQPGLAVFEWAAQWWAGVTTFPPAFAVPEDLAAYIAEQRRGLLRWRG